MQWSSEEIDTPLTNYTTSEEVINATESATWNMEQIMNNYTLSNYPAFNFCHNLNLTYNGTTYYGVLPNAPELLMIYNDRVNLDTYDPTLTTYSDKSLSNWNFGNNASSRCFTSNECDSSKIWYLNSSARWFDRGRTLRWGVCPIFEIPVND